jgi:protein arginine N-methyltransferase 1
MRRALSAPLRRVFSTYRELVKSSPTLRSLFYDLDNRGIFSHLDWHERMLADAVRVGAYHAGIRGAVRPGDVVIDLGTGTGILAMYAAQCQAKRVYAIDHSEFIEIAEFIARKNGFENITFVRANSRDFVCPEPADVLLHEQIGHTVFGENMVVNLLDLKKRALKPGGRIVPARFSLFVEPVTIKPEFAVPFVWDIPGLHLDLSALKHHDALHRYKNVGHDQRLVKNFEVERLLARPQPMLEVDMDVLASDADIPARFSLSRTIEHDGTLDGFCVFFEVRFPNGERFDTAPASRQTSWENVIIRVDRTPVQAGSTLTYEVAIDPLATTKLWTVTMAGDERSATSGRLTADA